MLCHDQHRHLLLKSVDGTHSHNLHTSYETVQQGQRVNGETHTHQYLKQTASKNREQAGKQANRAKDNNGSMHAQQLVSTSARERCQ